MVTQDPAALAPSPKTCTITPACLPKENCTNSTDDNCDGLIDACDPQCNGCTDDDLEPNDKAFNVPSLAVGTYANLKICPCRPDFFAFNVAMGKTISAK